MIVAGALTSVSAACFLRTQTDKCYIVPGAISALGVLAVAYAEKSGLMRALVGRRIPGQFSVGLIACWGFVHFLRGKEGLAPAASLWGIALFVWWRNRPGPTFSEAISNRQVKLNFDAMIDYMKESLTTPFGDATHLPTLRPSQRLFPM